ncbi:MAG: two-component regulator propeller domain-containing protein [Pseudomonadota bacterium]|nr:two-component regulator propeller domain-containing protein [Pseudomonadota bacterium]
MRLLVWLLGLLLCMVGAVRAQVPEMPHLRILGARDGLPSTALTVIEIDSAGFVWLGSADGLARYDGQGFRIWRHDPHTPDSLPNNHVQAMHVDSRDRLWLAVEFGGVAMLGANRAGFALLNNKTHPELGDSDVFALASRGDTLWLGTSNAGVFQVRAEGNDPAQWQLQALAELPSNTVLSMAADAHGGLWIGTRRGLAYWDGRRIQRIELPDDPNDGMIYSLLLENGRLWVGSSTGLFRRETNGQWLRLPYSPMFERPNAVVSMTRAADGSMWLGSQRRLWRVAGDDAIPLPVVADEGATLRSVMGLKMQADGGLWASVPGVGLGFLRPDWRSVAELKRGRAEHGLAAEMYRSLAPARRGGVWIAGADGHIERVDAGGVAEYIDGKQHHDVLRQIKPMAIYEDRNHRLWLGDVRLGLLRLDANKQLQRWHVDSVQDPLPAAGFLDLMTEGAGNTLWISIQGYGLQQRDIETGKVLKVIAASEANGLGAGDSEAIAVDAAGRLWVAGSHGLGWLDAASGKLVAPAGLAGGRVFAFAFEGDDALWLHRLGGLERHQYQDGEWKKVAELQAGRELPAVEAGGLVIDARRRVWVSSRRGLFLWDGQRAHLRTYGIANGLASQEFLDRGLVLETKRIWIPSLASRM